MFKVWFCKSCKSSWDYYEIYWKGKDRCPNCGSKFIEFKTIENVIEFKRVTE